MTINEALKTGEKIKLITTYEREFIGKILEIESKDETESEFNSILIKTIENEEFFIPENEIKSIENVD